MWKKVGVRGLMQPEKAPATTEQEGNGLDEETGLKYYAYKANKK